MERDAKRLAWTLAVAFAFLYLAFLPPGIYSVDGNSMLGVAESLVTRHSLAVGPDAAGVVGRGGQMYSRWYPLLSFLAAPLVAAAVPVARTFHLPLHYVAAAFVGVLPALFTAATVGLVALLAVQLGSTLAGARRAALVFGLGTMALVYARTFYADPLLALLVTGAVSLTITAVPQKVRLAALLALLAVLAKPTGIVLGPLLGLYLILRRAPFRVSALPVVGSGAGLLCYMGYNLARFGSPLNFGPENAFSLAWLPLGLAGQLVSPGRGILWYCPAVALVVVGVRKVARTRKMELLLMAALLAAFLAVHSAVPYWQGGWSWGPRYLLPVLPMLMGLTGLLKARAAKGLAVLGVVGFLVNAPTLVSYYERYYAESKEQGVSDEALLWSPGRAPLLHAWGAAGREIRDARTNDVRKMFHEAGTPSATIAESRALRVVAVWWWVLPVARIPRWMGALPSLLMVMYGVWKIMRFELPGD